MCPFHLIRHLNNHFHFDFYAKIEKGMEKDMNFSKMLLLKKALFFSNFCTITEKLKS
jgi:hypothetical protein